jgi:formate hydrogenlyase subunit 6/NADH:ubiquinone oxidoreductase subunit I
MKTVYERLAVFLDKLPGGYPATESGVEIRILKNLFDPEEAELTMALSRWPEPPSKIAERCNMDPSVLADKLDKMSKKGLIFRFSNEGQYLFTAVNFVSGILSFQLNNLNIELIENGEEYLPRLIESMKNQKTKQMRIIPVSKSISSELAVMPYEEAENIIKTQSKIVATPCICRTERKMAGEGCDAPVNNCLQFAFNADFYEQNGLGKAITQEEALKLLDEALEAGLILQPANSQAPHMLCMCCSCCCVYLRNIKKMRSPAGFVNSQHLSHVLKEDCTACGTCVEVCPMNAITMEDTAHINTERCIGCGLCVAKCDLSAIKLMKKENAEIPPANIVETFTNILKERGLA